MKQENDEQGIISEDILTVENIARDAALILYHHNREVFGVIRVLPTDAMIPHRTDRLEAKIGPFLEDYCRRAIEPVNSIRVKVYGGEYRWNVIKDQILLGMQELFLSKNIMSYLDDEGFYSVQYIPTERTAIKTLTVRPRGIVAVQEHILEINLEKPMISADEYEFWKRRSI